jgi:hypothetical protein
MQPRSRFILAALFAFAWTGLASGETAEPNTAIEPGALESVVEMQLDDAFEKLTASGEGDFLLSLAGPTSMDCTNSMRLETCVVTVAATRQPSIPATRAPH